MYSDQPNLSSEKGGCQVGSLVRATPPVSHDNPSVGHMHVHVHVMVCQMIVSMSQTSHNMAVWQCLM